MTLLHLVTLTSPSPRWMMRTRRWEQGLLCSPLYIPLLFSLCIPIPTAAYPKLVLQGDEWCMKLLRAKLLQSIGSLRRRQPNLVLLLSQLLKPLEAVCPSRCSSSCPLLELVVASVVSLKWGSLAVVCSLLRHLTVVGMSACSLYLPQASVCLIYVTSQ
jgi:hypothetical protein